MRFDRFTIKSQELVQNAQALASRHGNPQIEPEHLLAVMLSDREGIAVSMLRKLGAAPEGLAAEVMRSLERLPKVSGAGVGEASHFAPHQGRTGGGLCRGLPDEG